MKKFLYISAVFVSAFTFAACQKVQEAAVSENIVNVKVVTDKILEPDVAVKTYMGENISTEKPEVKWNEDDAIALYEFLGDETADNQHPASNGIELTGDDHIARFNVPLSAENTSSDSEYTYVAVYPADAISQGGSTNPFDRILIRQVQNAQFIGNDYLTANFDRNADVLIGTPVVRTARPGSDEPLSFSFTRPGTVGKLTLKNLVAGETVNDVEISLPEGTKVTGHSKINIKTGEVFDKGYNSHENVKVTIPNSGSASMVTVEGEPCVVYFRCLAGTWASGTAVTVKVTTSDAIYTKTTALPSDYEFIEGGLTSFSFNMATANRQELSGDFSGDWMIVSEKGETLYAMPAYTSGNNIKAVTYTLNGDNKAVGELDDCCYTIEKISEGSYAGYYTIQDVNGKYLYAAGGTSQNYLKADVLGADDSYYWTITCVDDTYKIVAKSIGRNVMQFNYGPENNPNPLFSCYSGASQLAVTLFPWDDVVADTTPVITVSSNTLEISADGTPKSTITVSGNRYVTGTITATSSDESWLLANVENGELSIVAEENTASESRTATITLSYTGADDVVINITQDAAGSGSEVVVNLNNDLYGISSGNNGEEQSAVVGGITITSGCLSSASSKTYYDTGHIRYYAKSYLELSVPAQYRIVSVNFAEPSSGKRWDGSITASSGIYYPNDKTWTGSAKTLTFSFGAQNRVASITVVVEPYDGPVEYEINCAGVTGGTIQSSVSSAAAGSEITLTATPEEGYELSFWNVTNASTSETVTVSNDKFTMPAANVNVSATFAKIDYTISRGTTEHGTFTINGSSDATVTANIGDQINLAATPEDGYVLSSWTVTKSQGGDVTVSSGKFTMPADNVTVTPLFVESVPTYSSLEALVAAGEPTTTGTLVTVTFADKIITEIYVTNAGYRNGIYLPVTAAPDNKIEIYCYNVPATWVVGGTVSGTLTNCTWKKYNNTWELCPEDWEDLTYTAPVRYDVNIDTSIQNGSVTPDKNQANAGETVTLSNTPAAGYELDSYSVVDASNNPVPVTNGKFTMPASSVTVSATFKTAEGGQGGSGKYVKVTSTADLTDGKYLIVYEGGNVALNGALTSDVASNTVAVTISNNEIASSTAVDAAAVTFKASDGSFLGGGGKYIGHTGSSNTLNYSNTALNNVVTFDSGNAVITAGNYVLRFNATSGQTRFRYYKSGQQAVQLYKYTTN